MIVVKHHDGWGGILLGFRYDRLSEILIYLRITFVPRIVNARIQVRVVGGIPHVVLEEPKEGVTNDIVKLVISPAGSRYESEIDLMPRQGGPDSISLAVFRDFPVTLSYCAGDPGKLYHLRQRAKRCDDPAASPSTLDPALR